MSKLEFDTKRVFTDELGRSIYVKYTDSIGRCGIVEIMGDGYVIAAYKVRHADGMIMAELSEIYDRLTKENIEPDTMMEALRYGRKIAELVIDMKGEDS